MTSHGSVSHLIAALKEGDPAAAGPLWQRYYRQLVGFARQKLRSVRRRAADEEDVVQNAFHSFFHAVAQGRFPHLGDRDSLWRLLVVMTANKAHRQRAYEQRQKRGGTLAGPMEIYQIGPDDEEALAKFVGTEPTPDFAAQVADEYRRLLDLLGDETLRQVAVWKLEGYPTTRSPTSSLAPAHGGPQAGLDSNPLEQGTGVVSEMLVPSTASPREIRQIERHLRPLRSGLEGRDAATRRETYLGQADEDLQDALLRQLLPLEWEYRLRAGDEPQAAEFEARFPTVGPLIETDRPRGCGRQRPSAPLPPD